MFLKGNHMNSNKLLLIPFGVVMVLVACGCKEPSKAEQKEAAKEIQQTQQQAVDLEAKNSGQPPASQTPGASQTGPGQP